MKRFNPVTETRRAPGQRRCSRDFKQEAETHGVDGRARAVARRTVDGRFEAEVDVVVRQRVEEAGKVRRYRLLVRSVRVDV